MKKIFKLITLSSVGLIVPATTVGLVVATNNNKSDKIEETEMIIQKGYFFDDMHFNNYEEILHYLINEKGMSIEEETVIGDVRNNYVDINNGTLNKSQLHDYISANVEFAWKKANGELTRNYEEAKATYFNPGLVNIRYTDGFGGAYFSEQEAKESRDRNIVLPYQGYYELPYLGSNYTPIDFTKLDLNNVSPVHSSLVKINPLNKQDIDFLMESVKNNFEKLIARNIVSPFDDFPYDIEYDEDSNGKVSETKTENFSFDNHKDQFQVLNFPTSIVGNYTKSFQIANPGWSASELSMGSPMVSSTKHSSFTYNPQDTVDQTFSFNYSMTEQALGGGKWSVSNRKNGKGFSYDELNAFFDGANWTGGNGETLNTSNDKKWKNFETDFLTTIGANSELFKNGDDTKINSVFKHSSNVQSLINNYLSAMQSKDNSTIENSLRSHLLNKYVYSESNNLYNRNQTFNANDLIRNFVTFEIGFNTELKEGDETGTNQFGLSVKDSGFDKMNITGVHNLHVKMTPVQNMKPFGTMDVNFTKKTNQSVTNKLVEQITGKLFDAQSQVNRLHFKVNLKNKLTGIKDHLFDVEWNLTDKTNPITIKLSNEVNSVDKYLQAQKLSKTELENFDATLILQERDNPMIVKHNFEEVVRQYWSSVRIVMKNLPALSRNKIYNSIKFDESVLFNIPNQEIKFGRYVLTSYNLLNPSLNPSNTLLIAGAFTTSVSEANNLKNTYSAKLSRPAEIYYVYNLNGELMNAAGEAIYDSFDIIRENIDKTISPIKSQNYLYIKDVNLPVVNSINNIYKLTLFEKNIYFDSNDNLIKYVMNYIYNNSKEE